ncbi:MAG: hypothetical protein Q9160_002286 [Pyrenula sp. 1 TL-2023]
MSRWKVRPSELQNYPDFATISGYHEIRLYLQRMKASLENVTDDQITPILLYGPPSRDKTMIARSCLNFRGVASFSGYSNRLTPFEGNPKCSVEALFQAAKKFQPCVISVDQIDRLIQSQGKVHRQRCLSALMNELKTIKDNKLKILLIACTDDPWSTLAIPEFRQLFKQLHVPLPNEATREEVIRNYLHKSDLVSVPMSGEGIRISAAAMEGFTCEEVTDFLRRATWHLLANSIQKPVDASTFMWFGWRNSDKSTFLAASSKDVEDCYAYEQDLTKS